MVNLWKVVFVKYFAAYLLFNLQTQQLTIFTVLLSFYRIICVSSATT